MSFWVSSTTWKDCGNPQPTFFTKILPDIDIEMSLGQICCSWTGSGEPLHIANYKKYPRNQNHYTSHPPSIFHKNGALVKRSFFHLAPPLAQRRSAIGGEPLARPTGYQPSELAIRSLSMLGIFGIYGEGHTLNLQMRGFFYYTSWWFQWFFIFIPIWEDSILTNIFQMGWNH